MGQTASQGALSQCWQSMGMNRTRGSSGSKKTFDPNPSHLPSLKDLFFTDKGHIVLSIAGDDTGPAADTAVKIDGHGPSIVGMGMGRIDILLRGNPFRQWGSKRWLLPFPV